MLTRNIASSERRAMASRLAVTTLQATCLLASVTIAAEPPPSAMLGFSAAHASDERAIEQRFDSALDASDQRAWVQRMASAPNQVGTAHDKANAEFMLEQFRSWGWD